MKPGTMELTYMVRGADGKEYGPVSLDQLGAWVREGRLPGQSAVRRSDMEHWAAAADFSELQPLFGATATTATTATAPQSAARPKDPAAAGQLRSGASWFYWVAGLSLINTIAAFSGSSWTFIGG